MIHTIRPGDTIYSIAREYGVSPALLQANNAITAPEQLVVGQTLVVLFPQTTYTVKQGDTLFSIAKEYQTTVKDLYRNNPSLMGKSDIVPGEELVISYRESPKRAITVNGYAYPFIADNVLAETLPNLSNITPFSYGFTSMGDLILLADDELVEKAKSSQVEPIMLLTSLNSNGNFDNTLSDLLLNDEELQDTLIEEIIETMRLKGYHILDVDFEFVFPKDRVAYADFIAKLNERLEPYGFDVWVALAPKTSADQKGLLYEAHDYALLGQAADRVLLMTYEWGYTYGPALPVAPLNKVREVVEYAVSEIPPEKILLGMPNYGYDFTLPYVQGESKATTLSNMDAVKLAYQKRAGIEYDETYQSPYFFYTENGKRHEVWFEDARSVQAKLDLMDEKELAGVSFWTVMKYFPAANLLLRSYQLTDN